MGFLSPPSPPAMPPPPPPPAPIVLPETPKVIEPPKDTTPPIPTAADPAIAQARVQQRKTASQSVGRGATILNMEGGKGIEDQPGDKKKNKSLLGE